MSFARLVRNSFISLASFGLGVVFDRQFNLYAKVANQNILDDELNRIDQIDSSRSKSIFPRYEYDNSTMVQQIGKYGFPSTDSIRSYKNFVLSYDRRNRIANWVLEYVTIDDITSDHYDRSGLDFHEDQSFHRYFRSTNQDYKSSGYDRGHLAAAGNYRSNPKFIAETYVLSNIAPQIGVGFNRDKWNELERYCRKRIREVKAAWICTGPLYLARKDPNNGKHYIEFEVIGPNQVSVPTHFFKVLLYEKDGHYRMESFVMPNEKINEKVSIQSFKVNPEVIERSAASTIFNSRRNFL
ncbi:endonuclease G, mitochondrial-like protein [Sarcoptes scabiei]|uniref:Endonuclease n=1 Tax=Sarcoptes scabiei TaxID=52283 RepID=A0A132ADX5_SARSC|nr:endonuclease G, mitochondrial-like protein [Sarcoptes scabiei]